MCKKLFLLISFVLLLSLTNAALAIPFDEAKAVWNFHIDDPAGDENGPIYTDLTLGYHNYIEEPDPGDGDPFQEVTGGEAGEHWDGWAVPSGCMWWSPMYVGTPEADDIKPVGAVTFFVRTRLGDVSGGDDGRMALAGMYDGSATYDNHPSYAIEIHDGEPVYVVTEAGQQGIARTECFLGTTIQPNVWYDMSGVFDPFNDTMTLTVIETRGPPVGKASIPVDFDELQYYDNVEWEIFCAPGYNWGSGEGDGHVELIAVWIGAHQDPPQVDPSCDIQE